jgi:hypothetical protein
MKLFKPPYDTSSIIDCLLHENNIILGDHIGGFDQDLNCTVLHNLNQIAGEYSIRPNVLYTNVLTEEIKKKYKNLNIHFFFDLQNKMVWEPFKNYNIHPNQNFRNFLCSFNGSPHVSRKLLTAILQRFSWFNSNYCSKNFSYSTSILDGHIAGYVPACNNFYRKFFIEEHSEDFFQSIVSFGHVQFKHDENIYNLEHKLTESFVHIVSETLATSYYPFVTEKFLYSIVTRGLFLAYAQPGWHAHVEKYYGFRPYNRLFDYRFDTIKNPIERLVELMSMIAKFSVMSADDWRDLYEMEKDTINYNYDHYFSGNYVKKSQTYESVK